MPEHIQTGLSYGSPSGGSYSSGTYGPLERGGRLDLYRPGDISYSLSTDAILSVDIGLEHSAMSDMSIDLPPFAGVTPERYAEGEMRYYHDGDLIFQSVIDEVNVSSDYTITLTGPAIEDDPLDEGEIDIAFENTLTADAIQYVCDEHTPHEATVHPAPERPITNEIAQEARTKAGFESILTTGSQADDAGSDIEPIREFPDSFETFLWRDSIPTIHDTSPFVVTDDGLTAHRSCVVQECEDGAVEGDTATITSDSAASGATTVKLVSAGDAVTFNVKLNYNVPAGAFAVSLRARRGSFGSAPYDRLKLDVDGSTFSTVKSGQIITAPGGNYEWHDFGGLYDEELDARGPDDDAHTIRIEKVEGDDELFLDVIAFRDDRYINSWNRTEQVDGNNALTGPPYYPAYNLIAFDSPALGADIDHVEVRHNFSARARNGVGGVTVPATGDTKAGGTIIDNDELVLEVTLDLPNAVVPDAYGVVFLGHYDDPNRTTTPTKGTEIQTVESYEMTYSGTALSVIEGRNIRGLHYRFSKISTTIRIGGSRSRTESKPARHASKAS